MCAWLCPGLGLPERAPCFGVPGCRRTWTWAPLNPLALFPPRQWRGLCRGFPQLEPGAQATAWVVAPVCIASVSPWSLVLSPPPPSHWHLQEHMGWIEGSKVEFLPGPCLWRGLPRSRKTRWACGSAHSGLWLPPSPRCAQPRTRGGLIGCDQAPTRCGPVREKWRLLRSGCPRALVRSLGPPPKARQPLPSGLPALCCSGDGPRVVKARQQKVLESQLSWL